MENNDGIKVSKYYAKELFNRAKLGVAESIIEMPKYDPNYSFLIKAEGKKYFLRVFSLSERKMAYEKFLYNNEVDIYKLLSETEGIRTPKVLFSEKDPEGNYTHYISEGYDIPYQKAAIPTIKDRRKLMFQAGADLAKSHLISGSGFGYEKMGLESKWGTAFKKIVDKIIADALLKNIEVDSVRIYKIIERAMPILNKVESHLVHLSLNKMKIFVSKNFVNFQGLAGWESSIWGDIAGDFVSFGGPFPLQSSKYFLRGYRTINPVEMDEEFRIRVNIMKMYKSLLMLVEPVYGIQDSSPKYNAFRSKARKILTKSLDDLEDPFPSKD
ncbi:MAG: hypothetical protein BWX72_01105 [Firmicutes bacterium ADurb.Bin080]|jgi:hypothetical protein|nr:hypothetical protein [Clostridiales bacterium]OQC15004.1 MAG: hypothetical protein BWX72_01105 [Firmicutes bacterium ADurb.Bin080]